MMELNKLDRYFMFLKYDEAFIDLWKKVLEGDEIRKFINVFDLLFVYVFVIRV